MGKHQKVVGQLLMDPESGEGSVRLPNSFFRDHSLMMQVDVVQDWIDDLMIGIDKPAEKLFSFFQGLIEQAQKHQETVKGSTPDTPES